MTLPSVVVLPIEESDSTESFLDRKRAVRSGCGGAFEFDWIVGVVIDDEWIGGIVEGDAEAPFASLNANPTPLPAILHRFLTVWSEEEEGNDFRSVFGARGIGTDRVLLVVLVLGLTTDGEEDATVEEDVEVEVEERKGAGLAKHERISGLVDEDVNVGRIVAPPVPNPVPIAAPARLSTSGRTASIESRDVRFRSKCGDRGDGLMATSVEMRDGFFDNE